MFESKSEKIFQSLKEIYSTVRGTYVPGRQVTVLPDDVWVVSYPKSGNTWTRFLIANLVCQNEKVSFLNIERLVPDIYVSSDRMLLSLPRPRVLKSHEYYDPRYRRTLCVVRDPRDVLLSYYHHHVKFRKIKEGHPLERFAESFMRGELDPFGSWGENVGSWLGAKQGDDDFMLLRYEDLLVATAENLALVASFIGISASEDILKTAVENSSADRMRNMERQEVDHWEPTRQSRQDKPFVRKATSGDWKEELPEEVSEMVVDRWHSQMKTLGYI